MTIRESLGELRDRIDDLQKRLAERSDELRADERVPAEDRARVDTMHEQAKAVKDRLPAEEGSAWDGVKHEVQRDIDALVKDFEHTIAYIDEHYRETQ